jgi:hypothetical protein
MSMDKKLPLEHRCIARSVHIKIQVLFPHHPHQLRIHNLHHQYFFSFYHLEFLLLLCSYPHLQHFPV